MWGIALVVGGLTTFGVAAAIMRGDYLMPSLVLTAMVFILLQRWYARRKILLLFRERTPEKAIAYCRRSTSGLPNGRAIGSYLSSFVLALYEEYDRSREELAGVSWASLPPMYEGFRTHVLSTLALLQEKNPKKAWDLAREARDLCSVSSALPGSAQSQKALEAHMRACELLSGEASDETVPWLEESLRELKPFALILPAWSLAVYFSRSKRQDKAIRYAAIVRDLAPFCRPLTTENSAAFEGALSPHRD